MSEIYTDPPQSRNEAIIKATIDGTEYTSPPQSRMEDLLLELKEAIEHGGGGGTTNYNQLSNKPKINDVELSGNKTSSDLGLMPEYEVDTTPTESSENLITSGAVWSADKNINNKLQGSKTAGSTDGSPFEIPDYGMTESISLYFKPTQDLHGYDKPWAGGAGKNKYPIMIGREYFEDNAGATHTTDADELTITMTSTSNSGVYSSYNGSELNNLSKTLNGTYTCSFDIKANKNVRLMVGYQGHGEEYIDVTTSWQRVHTTTVFDGIGYAYVIYNQSEEDVSVNVRNFMLEQGSTATDFAPYSNICPISGQDNATFEWTGKNLVSELLEGVWLGADGTFSDQNINYTSSPKIKINPSTTYTFTCDVGYMAPDNAILFYDENDNYLGVNKLVAFPNQNSVTFTTQNNAHYASITVNKPKNEVGYFQLEVGNQATAYEPYTHGEVSMNFGNTYYGGFCQFNGQIYSDWDYIASYNGETLSGEWVSDRDEYVAGTTPTIGAEVAYKTTPSYVRVTPPANLNLTDDYPIEYNGYMASIDYQPKNTVLAEAKKYTNQEIAKLGFPQPPTTDGTYHLECSVSGGTPTIRWVSNS